MSDENKKGNTLKRMLNILKKSSDAEKKKSEERKKKSKSKPKGVAAKRFGMITFWLLFSFMFLVTTVNIFGGGSSLGDINNLSDRNKLHDHEALEFSKNFVHDYFNWSTDKHGEEELKDNIEPYFLNGIDSLGGINYDKEWSSSVDKRDIEIKDIKEIDNNRARFVFKVKIIMKSKTDKKDSKIDKDKLSYEEILEEKEEVRVVNGYKVKETEKYIDVPVYFDDDAKKYAIYDLPSFTFVNEDKLDSYPENDFSQLNSLNDHYVENNVESFLDTFFESYSKDDPDKLSYILEDERHQYGLGGTMEYSSVEKSNIYMVDENHNRFIVDAEVVLKEPTTEYEFTNKFLLVIKRKDQRYVVESLNDEEYVAELVESNISNEEESDNTNNDNEIKENEMNNENKSNNSN